MSLKNTESQSCTRAGPGPSLVSGAGDQGLRDARGPAGTRSHTSASFVLWPVSHGLPEAFLKGEDWQRRGAGDEAGHMKAKPSARSGERPLRLAEDEAPLPRTGGHLPPSLQLGQSSEDQHHCQLGQAGRSGRKKVLGGLTFTRPREGSKGFWKIPPCREDDPHPQAVFPESGSLIHLLSR